MKRYPGTIPITVDLNILAKYHAAAKHKVERLTKQGIPTNNYSDTLTIIIIESDEGLHPASRYWQYATDVGLTESLANDLLYLVHLNLRHEWSVYAATLITNDHPNGLSLESDAINELNLISHARDELMKIRDLCLLLENHLAETDINFSYRSGIKKKGKEVREKYKILGVEIFDPKQVQSILKYTLDLVFNEAKNGFNDVLREILKDKKPEYSVISELLELLPVPPLKLEDAIISFRKYLIDVCIKFLNEEANINVTKDKISVPVGKLIYSAFSLFQLIEPALIENHIDDTSRVKYIRSMALNAGNIRKLNPKAEVKKNPVYTFKDISLEFYDDF